MATLKFSATLAVMETQLQTSAEPTALRTAACLAQELCVSDAVKKKKPKTLNISWDVRARPQLAVLLVYGGLRLRS